MIGLIMKHEWLLLVRERLLFVTVPIYALLIAYAVINGAHWKQFLSANTTAATQYANGNLDKLVGEVERIESGAPFNAYEDPRNPGRFARTLGFEMATKPPSPTAVIAVGQSDVYPSYLKVQWRPMFKQSNTDETENPSNLATGRFDLGYVLVYLYPLLIIALSYNILSAEREGGTQALLLSQPVSVRQFVIGKILLRGIVIIGLAAGLSLLGVLFSSPEILSSAGGWWRVAMWMSIVIVYGAFWFGLAVVVNAFANKSSTNALILMGTWLTLVLIVPAALNLLAKAAYPLPSRIELVQAMRRADVVAQKEEAATELDKAATDLSSRSGEDAVVTSINNFNKRVLPLEQRGEAIAAPIFNEFESQRAAQQSLAERMKYVSPAIVIQSGLAQIADSSSSAFSQFSAQVQAYHQQWRDYFFSRVMQDQMMTKEDMRSVPRFNYVPESDGAVFWRSFSDFACLAAFAAVVLLVGFARLQRYAPATR